MLNCQQLSVCACVYTHAQPLAWVPGAAHCVALICRAGAEPCAGHGSAAACSAASWGPTPLGDSSTAATTFAAQRKHILICLSCFYWQQLWQKQSQAESVCMGSEGVSLQCVVYFHDSCNILVQESQKHSTIQVTDGNTESECLSALKHPLPTCQCAPYKKVK